jgi:thioredoxin-related protein
LETRCVFVQNFNFLIFLDIQICCFKDFEFLLDENVLCNRVFNGTFGALSLPASYEIVFERLGFPDDHSQPLLIDFLSEEAVQKSPDESLFDFLANNLKKTSYSNSPRLFIQQFQAVNSSNIALAKIEKAENEYFGEYLDELLWNKQQNVILVLTSRSCGYCDVAKRYENLSKMSLKRHFRAALDAKFYLESRISASVMASLSFNILQVDSIDVPAWLDFKHYPQVLLLPAKSKSGADSKEWR